MSTVHDPIKERITLHGLGFIQVILGGNQRLHVWHPDLPKRKCFEHSSIHDHRFSFTSQVLVGEQINVRYRVTDSTRMQNISRAVGMEYIAYKHEGARLPTGSRPWTPSLLLKLEEINTQIIPAGHLYDMQKYELHKTIPGGDGRVATLMTKTEEGSFGAHSLCKIGVEPDVEFDRYQLSENELWEYVKSVLLDR